MKFVKLKFMGTGYKDKYQAYVKVLDNQDIIYEGYTNNGYVELCLKKRKCYKVIAYLCNKYLKSSFLVTKSHEVYIFSFYDNFPILRKITFLLTDYYYKNLPIQKGELYLWQK